MCKNIQILSNMIIGLSPGPAMALNGQCFILLCSKGTVNRRPIRSLASKAMLNFEGFDLVLGCIYLKLFQVLKIDVIVTSKHIFPQN